MTLLLLGVENWDGPVNRARIASLGLSAGDVAVLRRELTRGRDALVAAQEARAARPDAPARRSADERREMFAAQEAVTAEVYGRLLEFLSAEGRPTLRAYVEAEKRNVRILRSGAGQAGPADR